MKKRSSVGGRCTVDLSRRTLRFDSDNEFTSFRESRKNNGYSFSETRVLPGLPGNSRLTKKERSGER